MKCTYCGEESTTYDHIIPVSFASSIPRKARQGAKDPGKMVTCCQQCNSWLGAKLLLTMRDRRQHIIDKLLSSLVGDTDWTQDELDDLGPNLKSAVLRGCVENKTMKKRLSFAKQHIWL